MPYRGLHLRMLSDRSGRDASAAIRRRRAVRSPLRLTAVPLDVGRAEAISTGSDWRRMSIAVRAV